MADAEINIQITSDSSGAQKDVEQTAQKFESFGQRFKATFAGVLSADFVQKLAKGIYDFGKSSVDAYSAAEETQTKFMDSMSRLPDASDATTKALLDQAKALASVTTFSAGQTKAADATLASFGLTGTQIRTLLPLVQDMATKLGEDLPTAAGQVGKALLGSGRGLKGLGIDFSDTGTLAGNFAEVQDALQGKVGGLAKEMGASAGGQMKIMENQFGALKVAIGSGLMPVLEGLLPVLQPIFQFIAANSKWLIPLAVGVIAVAAAFIFLNFAVGLFMDNPPVLLLLAIAAAVVAIVAVIILLVKNWDTVWSAIKTGAADVWHFMLVVWGGILDAIHAVWDFIVQWWPVLAGVLLGPIGLAAGLIIKYWSDIWNAAVAVWQWISSAWNAVYYWITAPFIAAWNWVAAVFSGIPGFFAGLIGWIAGAFSRVFGIITAPFAAAWGWIASTVGAIASWFAGIPGAIAGALSGVFAAIIGPFQSAWNWISSNILGPLKGAWNGVANTLNAIHISAHIPSNPITDFLHVSGLGFDWSPPWHIPTLAQGGLMTRSGLVFAHAGEVISPAPAHITNRNGPLVNIETVRLGEHVDVTVFSKKLAWTLQTAAV